MAGFISGVAVGFEFVNTPFQESAFILDLVIIRFVFIYGESSENA